MLEINKETALHRNRDEIGRLGTALRAPARAGQGRFAARLAAIRIFEASGDPKDTTQYLDIHRLFRRGKTWAICREELATNGPMTTTELVAELMWARKPPEGDRVMNRNHALGMRPPIPETILVDHQITGTQQGG